jgi:hypothetical protein
MAIKLIRKLNLVNLLPQDIKLIGRKFLYAQKDEIPELQANEKDFLNQQYFKEDLAQLESLVEMDLSDWYEL